MSTPKQGTIERTVLDALQSAGDAGVTFLDFPPEVGMTDELLAEVIQRLRHGIYESENDDEFKFDA